MNNKVEQAASIFMEAFNSVNNGASIDEAKEIAWDKTIKAMPAVDGWRNSFITQMRQAGGMKFTRRYGARNYQALIQMIGAGVRSARKAADEPEEPEQQQTGTRTISELILSWAENHDWVPGEAILGHFTDRAFHSWRTSYTVLRDNGYEYERDGYGYTITARPDILTQVKSMSRDKLLSMSKEQLADLLYDVIQS